MKKHNGIIDFLKFVVMLINIMGGHFVVTGAVNGLYPFSGNGIFVEFFLIITGYYTLEHFKKLDVKRVCGGGRKRLF